MKFSAGHFSYRRVRRHIWDRSDEAESSPSGKADGLVVSLPSLYFASTIGKPLYWYLRMKKVIKPFSTNNTFIRCWACIKVETWKRRCFVYVEGSFRARHKEFWVWQEIKTSILESER